ncbi:MAG: hypothetical protein ACP5UT_07100 [Bryobacteraceae bacterium]
MTRALLRVLFLTGGMAAVGAAQTAIEYGGAAGAKTAGDGAKKLGDSLGRIFSKSGEALNASRRDGARSPASSTAVRRSSSSPRPAAVDPKTAETVRATAEAFAKREPGLSAAELEALLGPPSFRVLMSLEGRMVELLEYTAGRKLPGTVRIVDGKVAEVRPASAEVRP